MTSPVPPTRFALGPRRTTALVVVAVAAVLVGGGRLVPGANRATPTAPNTTAARPSTATTTATAANGVTPATDGTTTTAPPRIVGSISRRTVLLVGDDTGREFQLDSRAFQFFDHTRAGSGLARPDTYDWSAALRTLLPTLPDRATVVVALGGNDAQPLTSTAQSAPAIDFGSSAWPGAYAARAGALMDTIVASGHPLIWIGPIDSPDPAFGARLHIVRQSLLAAVATRPAVRFVDTWALFRGPNDSYSPTLVVGGVPTRVHAADGYHLDGDGEARLTETVRQAFIAVLAPASG